MCFCFVGKFGMGGGGLGFWPPIAFNLARFNIILSAISVVANKSVAKANNSITDRICVYMRTSYWAQWVKWLNY